jgi:hypothetical protein
MLSKKARDNILRQLRMNKYETRSSKFETILNDQNSKFKTKNRRIGICFGNLNICIFNLLRISKFDI